MQYSTDKQSNKELYTALIAALTELTCFGKSTLLQQLVENIKQSNDNDAPKRDHNMMATLFVYLLLKYNHDVANSILNDPKNQSLLNHIKNIKEFDQNELDLAVKTLKDIKHITSLKPTGKAG